MHPLPFSIPRKNLKIAFGVSLLLWGIFWLLLLSLRGDAQELRKVYVAVPGISPGASSTFVIAKGQDP
jgi:hypothetical protein